MTSDSQPKMPMRGVTYALLASALFGLTTPISKGLLNQTNPILLAGLFYLGSGIGLTVYRLLFRRLKPDSLLEPKLLKKDWLYLAGAILSGGVIAPVLLMSGLVSTQASTASLFLNMEGVFTALFAWFVFKENYDARIFVGMLLIMAGGAILSFASANSFIPSTGTLLILGACLCWALDNNLTRKVSNADPAQITSYKGLVAGLVNTSLALAMGTQLPNLSQLSITLLVGFLGYGVSLVFYVLGLRLIGAARTGAYFAIAPFIGAVVSMFFFREAITIQLVMAGGFMGLGLWLHLSEHHSHPHVHEGLEHAHSHMHDEHHGHDHTLENQHGEPHVHAHKHETISHDHPHFPDQHHSHEH